MKILPILAGGALIAMAAAPHASAQRGGVAVLDIDRVAKELNVDQAVLGELKRIETGLNTELNQMRNNLQVQMNQLEVQAGQQRTQQMQQQLVAANRRLNQQFNQEKAKAQSALAAERIKRINEFRDKLKPIAQEAARERGLDIVLTKSPQVYTFVAAVDITDDVIKGAKAAGLEAEVSAEPPPAAAPASAPSGAGSETSETPAEPANPDGGGSGDD